MKYIGGEFIEKDLEPYLLNEPALAETQNPLGAIMLQSASDGIAAIINQTTTHNLPTLYHPINFCNATLQVIKGKVKHKLNLISYQNIQDLDVCDTEKDNFLLIVHFNATYNDMLTSQPSLLKRFIVIEDFVQYPFHIHLKKSKYAVNSIRKILPIELALVYGLEGIEQFSEKKSQYFTLKKEAVSIKQRYINSDHTVTESDYLNLFRKAENALNTDQIFTAQNSEKEKFAKLDINALILKRKNNYTALFKLMEQCEKITILPGSYMYLMLLTNQQAGLKKYLAGNGIFATIHWADSADFELNNRILSIPVDQRYDYTDMLKIATALINYFK